MAVTRHMFTVPGPTGDVPAQGRLVFTASRRRVIQGLPSTTILPGPITVKLVNGLFEHDIPATGPDWMWIVEEMISGAPGRRTYRTVPEVEQIDLMDLPTVDPATLSPTAEPEAAWWTHVDGLALAMAEAREIAAAAKAAAQVASTEAVTDAAAALTRAETAETSAAAATASANLAVARAEVATAQANLAMSASTAAQQAVEHLAVTPDEDDPDAIILHFPTWRLWPGDPDSIRLTVGVEA